MAYLEQLDTRLFWWVNGHNNSVLDWLMWISSQHWCWLVVVVAVYLLVTMRHDRSGWLWVLLGIGLCFLLADQISNNAIKEGVQRLRPCWALEEVRMFRTTKGGPYGFVSSHAANAFAIAMYFSLMYGGRKSNKTGDSEERYRSPLLPYLLVGWALIVGYSRAYLGKHYPGDVICGALLGLGVGAVVYFAISWIRRRMSSRSSA